VSGMLSDPPLRSLLWRLAGARLQRLTPHNAYRLRVILLRAFGATLTPKSRVRRTAVIERPWRLTVGPGAILGDGCEISGPGEVRVGARCTVSQLVHIATAALVRDGDVGFREQAAPVTIEDDVWIAADTLVMPGSVVSTETVVGARSLVDGELPPAMIAAGVPAKARKERVFTRRPSEAGLA